MTLLEKFRRHGLVGGRMSLGWALRDWRLTPTVMSLPHVFLAQNVQPRLALPPTMPEPAILLEPKNHFLL